MIKDNLLQSCIAYEELCYKTAVAAIRPRPTARLKPTLPSHISSKPILEFGPRMGLRRLFKHPPQSPELSPIAPTPKPIPSVGDPLNVSSPSLRDLNMPKGKTLLEWMKGVGGVTGNKIKSIKDAPQKIQELYKKLMTPGNEFVLPDEKNIWRDKKGKVKMREDIFDSEGNINPEYNLEALAAELQARDAIALQKQQAAQAAKQKAEAQFAKIQEMAKKIAAAKSPIGQAKSFAWKALSVSGSLGLLYQMLTSKSPQSSSQDKKEIINYLSSEKSSEELSIKNTNKNIEDLNQTLSSLKGSVGDNALDNALDNVILKNNELASNLNSIDSPLSLDDPSSLKNFASKISELEPKVIKHIINLQKLKVVLITRGDIEHAQKCDILINSLIEKLAIIQSTRESIG